MNYQVYFYQDRSECSAGIYATEQLAKELCESINALQESKAFIREIFVADTLPVIYTHCAYINFEDINKVDVQQLEFIQTSDTFIKPLMTHILLRPLVGVGALGTHEADAYSKVKSKMEEVIKNGTYQHWRDSIRLKAIAHKNAFDLSLKHGIEMSEQNYPDDLASYEDMDAWEKILQQCYRDVGFKVS